MQEVVCLDSLYDRYIRKYKEDDVKIVETINDVLSFPIASYEGLQKRKKALDMYKIQLEKLLNIPKVEQKSKEWFEMRSEMITASDFGQALGEGKFGSVNQIYKKKSGYEEESFSHYIPPLKWGCMFEPVATEIYMKRNNINVYEFGILRHPIISHFGASPDGITEQGIMLEIKCPFKRKITGEIPSQYYYQIQGQLEVCDLDECDYMECGFTLYNTENDFWNDDTYPFEKGVIWEFNKKNSEEKKPYYLYSPCISILSKEEEKNELHKWVNDKCNDLYNDENVEKENIKPHFWRLDIYNVVRVYRDKVFIKSKMEDLTEVWKKIIHYRQDRDSYLTEVCSKRPRKTTATKEKENKEIKENQEKEIKENQEKIVDFVFHNEDD